MSRGERWNREEALAMYDHGVAMGKLSEWPARLEGYTDGYRAGWMNGLLYGAILVATLTMFVFRFFQWIRRYLRWRYRHQ